MNRTVAFAISVCVVLTACGAYVYVSHSPKFNLTHIDIQGNHKVSHKEILEGARLELGTNVLRIPLWRIKQHLRKDERIREAWVRLKLPNRVSIEVEEKVPALWMNLPQGLCGLSRDQMSVPLEVEDLARDLPVVTGFASPPASRRQNQKAVPYRRYPDTKAKLALDLYNAVLQEDSSLMETISEICLRDETNLILYLVPGGTEVNMGKGDFKKKLKRVKAILSYEERPERLACIDLRFKDQVVVRKSSQGLAGSGSQCGNHRLANKGAEGSGEQENL